MQRFWHKIRKNKTARLPFQFIAVDTETQERRLDAFRTFHSLRLGCAIYFTLPHGDKKKPQRSVITFTTTAAFWDWVELQIQPRSRVIVSAHNLAFDFLVLDAAKELQRRGFTCDFPVSGNGRFITSARRKNCRLLFVDTLNYVMVPLKELGESLGLPKMTMPADDAPQGDLERYCLRDTEIVERFWQALIEFLRGNDFGSFAPTAASLAYKIFRHRFLRNKLLVHNHSAALALERAAFMGGRNECFAIGQLPEREYTLVDVNSLYPAVMRGHRFPTIFMDYRLSVPVSQLRQRIRTAFCISRVVVHTGVPAYPCHSANGLIFPVGTFETVLTSPELADALKHGRIVKVLELATYRQADVFTPFVDALYQMRRRFKSEQNFAFDLFAKLLLNGLYGKFGQRGYHRQPMPRNRAILYGHTEGYSQKWHSRFAVTYWNGVGYIDYQSGEAMESMPGLAAAVTAYGRMRLWSLMQRAGRENVVYVDTDSLIVNAVGLANLQAEIAPTRLGKLKIVEAAKTLKLNGVKDYIFGASMRRKGIKHSAVELPGDFYEQIRFATFRENVQNGITDGVEMRTERKQIRRVYTKGLVGTDGTVAPICLDCFSS